MCSVSVLRPVYLYRRLLLLLVPYRILALALSGFLTCEHSSGALEQLNIDN